MNSSQRDDDARGLPIAEVAPRPEIAHLAIGMFDGVHIGHAAVIREMLEERAESHHGTAVLTFEPHPLTVVAPDRAPARLLRPEDRAALLRARGVDQVVTVTFDAVTRAITPGDFIDELRRIFPRLETICIGENWTFGRGREGNVALLEREGAAHGFAVVKVPVVNLDGGGGGPVSSTRIREAISRGDMALAGRLLGRPYAVSGVVVHGEKRGRQLGYPTANVAEIYELLPPNGVYAAITRLRVDSRTFASMVNIGRRPTVAADLPPTVESHLLDFTGDLYGQEVELLDFRRLRDERKFASLTELKEQLARDEAAARGGGLMNPNKV